MDIIQIKGTDIWGCVKADLFYTSSKSDTTRKCKAFAKRYNLVECDAIPLA